MNDVQELLTELRSKGWTKAAISDEIGVEYDTVARWERGVRYPNNVGGVKLQLSELLRRRRVPKKRRYKKSPPAA